MTIDPQDPDWAALAPIRTLGPIERVPGGVRCSTEVGPLAAIAYARDVFRVTLGDAGGPDYGILVSATDPPAVEVDQSADGFVLRAGALRLALQADPLRLSLERAGRALLASSTDAHFRRPHRLPPFARTADGWLAALGLASGEAVYGLGEKWAG